jgi:hypothetical protein
MVKYILRSNCPNWSRHDGVLEKKLTQYNHTERLQAEPIHLSMLLPYGFQGIIMIDRSLQSFHDRSRGWTLIASSQPHNDSGNPGTN